MSGYSDPINNDNDNDNDNDVIMIMTGNPDHAAWF